MSKRKPLLEYTIPEVWQSLKQGLKQKPSDFFSKTPNSVLLWNGLFYALFIGLTIYDWQIGACIACLTSLFYLACTVDETDLTYHYWIYASWLFWFAVLVMIIISFIYYVFVKPIDKFNTWLDDPYANKWNKFNAYISNPTLPLNRELSNLFSKEYDQSSANSREALFKSNPKYWMKLLKQYQGKPIYWTTADGRKLNIETIPQQHLSNIIWFNMVFHKRNQYNCNMTKLMRHQIDLNFDGKLLDWKPLPIPQELKWLKDLNMLTETGDIMFEGVKIGSITHINNWETYTK